MNATYEKADGKVKVFFSVSPEKFEEAINKAYLENKKNISLPGFRKGKIARQMIEAYYGKRFFYGDAIDALLYPSYTEALEELANEFEPIGRPEADVLEAEKETGVKFVVEVLTEPEANISDYKGITYSAVKREVTDEDVDAAIEEARKKNSRIVTVAERPSKTGDDLLIDFKGYMEGTPFPGGEAKNHNVVIGSGALIDTFEQQLTEHVIGDEFTINVKFPDDYHSEEHAGREAMFEVKINDIRERVLPEADDDFAQDVSEFDTFDEYKADLKKQLLKRADDDFEAERRTQILKKLAEKCEADIPQCMVDEAVETRIENIKEAFGGYISMKQYANFLGITDEELDARLEEEANEMVRFRLALLKIAEIEGIEVSDEDVTKSIDEFIEKIPPNYAGEYKDKLYASNKHRKGVKRDLLMERALKIVIESAVYKKEEENE